MPVTNYHTGYHTTDHMSYHTIERNDVIAVQGYRTTDYTTDHTTYHTTYHMTDHATNHVTHRYNVIAIQNAIGTYID
jgi:hypothetical protein